MRRVAYQPLSNTIVTGIVNKDGKTWKSNSKVDVTEDSIKAVFEWLKRECKDGGKRYYEVEFTNTTGKIIFDLGESEKK